MRAKYLLLLSLLFTMLGGLAFPAMEHGMPYAEAALGGCVAAAVLLLAFGIERAGMEREADLRGDKIDDLAWSTTTNLAAVRDWAHVVAERDKDELVRLRAMVKGLVDRIGAQSELLARCAERAVAKDTCPEVADPRPASRQCDSVGKADPVGDEWAPKLEAE